jgi:hypothetical protein
MTGSSNSNYMAVFRAAQGRFRAMTAAICSVALLSATTSFAQIASGTTGIDSTGNAASEMAACKSGKTQQSRQTCMEEVRNANAARRAGKVDNAGGQFKANALMRCNAFKGEDKAACESRVTGMGKSAGSVAGGGVITEVQTTVAPTPSEAVSSQPRTGTDTIMSPPTVK